MNELDPRTDPSAEQDGPRTYRGRSLEELIPRIKDELGPDAVILRQRDGLAGGIGGFFQRQFVEVEAQAGDEPGPAAAAGSRLDLLDDAPARPEPYERPLVRGGGLFERTGRPEAYPPRPETSAAETAPAEPSAGYPDPYRAAAARGASPDPDPAVAEGLRAPAIQTMLDQAAPFVGEGPGAFARELEAASRDELGAYHDEHAAATGPAPVSPAAPAAAAPVRERPTSAQNLERTLSEGGLRPALAAEIVAEALSHRTPFAASRGLKRLVRAGLADRVPVLSTPGAGGRTIAFVGAGGAGKTVCAARLASAYAAAGDLPVLCLALDAEDGGARLAALVAPSGVETRSVDSVSDARAWIRASAPEALVVVDTPGLSPHEPEHVTRLAKRLDGLGVGEVHLTVPATVSSAAAGELAAGLAALQPSAIALTHADETRHAGPVVALAIEHGLPFSYVGSGTAPTEGLELADPAVLATMVLR